MFVHVLCIAFAYSGVVKRGSENAGILSEGTGMRVPCSRAYLRLSFCMYCNLDMFRDDDGGCIFLPFL